MRWRGSLCARVPIHIDLGNFFKTYGSLPLLFLLIGCSIQIHIVFTYWCEHLTIQSNGLIVLESVIVFHEFFLLMMFLDHIIIGVVPSQKLMHAMKLFLLARQIREFSLGTILG